MPAHLLLRLFLKLSVRTVPEMTSELMSEPVSEPMSVLADPRDDAHTRTTSNTFNSSTIKHTLHKDVMRHHSPIWKRDRRSSSDEPENTELNHTDLGNTDLGNTDLENTDLENTSLKGADPENAEFTNAERVLDEDHVDAVKRRRHVEALNLDEDDPGLDDLSADDLDAGDLGADEPSADDLGVDDLGVDDLSSADHEHLDEESSPQRSLRVPPPSATTISVIQFEVNAKDPLDLETLKRDLVIEDLIESGQVLAPQITAECGSKMLPRQRLTFFPSGEHKTLYETLYERLGEALNTSTQDDQDHALSHLMSLALETFTELESAGCPPLALDHRHVWYHAELDQAQAWLTTGSDGSWARAASTFITHCLMLCADMSGEELPSGDELLEVIELLGYIDAVTPRQIAALRRGLSDSSITCDELRSLWLDRPKYHEATHSIDGFERIADQRVGIEKYRKRATQLLDVSEQQEDRYAESTLTVNGSRYWLGAVFDGVSTCDYGSGAQIAEAARSAVIDALEDIPEHEKLSAMVRDHGPGVILDFVFNYLRKIVLKRLETLSIQAGVELDDTSVHMPTSTATLALVDERGQVWVKWVGDSPAMILTNRDELLTLCASHCAQHERVSCGEDIAYAVKAEGAHALTADLSSVALNTGLGVDEAQYQLAPYETLILCSDGLIDGFKDGRKRLGSDAFALREITRWACETKAVGQTASQAASQTASQTASQERDLYRLVTGLCHEADMRRGVDNITVLGMRPRWRLSADGRSDHKRGRSEHERSERSRSEHGRSERSQSERSRSASSRSASDHTSREDRPRVRNESADSSQKKRREGSGRKTKGHKHKSSRSGR